MSSIHYILLFVILISSVTARPPVHKEQDNKLTGMEPLELDDYVDYFEDFFPVLNNSTKLNENYQYEKKKYLTSVGFPAKIKKML